MRTSAPGNKRLATRAGGQGFTLLELLVVVSVIALAAGLAVLALRDASAQRLEQEAVRLSALLEAGRLESRLSGRALAWRPRAPDQVPGSGPTAPGRGDPFTFESDRRDLGSKVLPQLSRAWLHEGTTAEVLGASAIVLGPDPILPIQRIRLRHGSRELIVATDGLGPFRIVDTGAGR